MQRRKSIRNWLEFLPAWILIQILCWAPLPLARLSARCVAAALRIATPRWRSIAHRNVEIAFPEIPLAARRNLVRGCYRNLGRVLLILARLPRLNSRNIHGWIEYSGFEHYATAKAAGRGVLFLTAHLGNWELSSAAHALFGNPMHVMVRPLDNPLLNRVVDRRRSLFGNRTIQKRQAARDVLRALRNNEAVGILADQNAAGEDGLFVDFFGRPASATRSVAQLAARSGAAVIPGFAFWNQSRKKYVLQFYAPEQLVTGGSRDRDLERNVQLCQAAIEAAIRERPEQWLWIHRRWKRRPAGEPSLY